MATSGKGTATVGYNVQIAVDAEHHLIVAHEAINQGHDRSQLAPMGLKAQEATGCEQVTALAGRGYFSGDQVLSCEGTGVAPIRRRARPLHMPGGRKTHQGPSARGSHRRLRPLPPPERLLHLSAQTPVHADQAADYQALGE